MKDELSLVQLDKFRENLKYEINSFGFDADCNTADWILANFLVDCLQAFYNTQYLKSEDR